MMILDDVTKKQINDCVYSLKNILDQGLLGVYLYGSWHCFLTPHFLTNLHFSKF